MLRRTTIGAIGAGLLALGATAPAHAATFAVNNTSSAGAGSLRAAITAANGTAAPDTIEFAIPGNGVHTITPAVQLPAITQPVSIEGYSQPGSSAAARRESRPSPRSSSTGSTSSAASTSRATASKSAGS
jgi:hypothetical protein